MRASKVIYHPHGAADNFQTVEQTLDSLDTTTSGLVPSVFSRTGAIVAAAGDYTYAANTLALPRSYLAGLGTSNNASPNSKIDVAAGACRDDTDALNIILTAKTVDCTTTGANALDAGALANATWYHLFAIAKADGTAATLASTSVASPTFPTGYTLKRRIGSFKTDGSAHIIPYTQRGDVFLWTAIVQDQSVTLSTTDTNYAISTPLGVQVLATVQAFHSSGGNATGFRIYSNAQSNQAISPSGDAYASVGATAVGSTSVRVVGTVQVLTDTASQIRAVADASSTFVLTTVGWTDSRGRDA